MNDHTLGNGPGTGRLEAFSDGVFAIAITLLILEIKVPDLGHSPSNLATMESLVALWPKVGGYLLTFLMIAIYWVNHHHLFHRIAHSDAGLMWHNNHLLLWICFFPFPTAFLGEHPSSPIAVTIYGVVAACAALAYLLLQRHAWKYRLFSDTFTADAYLAEIKKNVLTLAMYIGAIGIAWFWPAVSLGIYASMALSYFFPKKAEKR